MLCFHIATYRCIEEENVELLQNLLFTNNKLAKINCAKRNTDKAFNLDSFSRNSIIQDGLLHNYI